ncbi:exodeoxyribonuclease V subunit beta [Xylophilus rhododendri]|uniref:RecBCD enzyme subunit RecB n=1 Tax=Xylophilus rhododendri TaxID=2697032 RepID=A0A857J287_9BURK|nr:exodeoxyribonuclease V subunit beta [Xylophilus rhododendri]QHI97192.1 exodeoxyribonuclease V subunit beta [Xylophilus rhododendri]
MSPDLQPAHLPPLLDPLRFPLSGSRLIEASAGTGKTFTIAALYLRLVLGHGGEAAFSRALTPPDILVVTFTDAATKELRDRIRARLSEAADAFLQEPATVPALSPGEDLLYDLRADYPCADWPRCARLLRLAAEWMDESAVSTIHGWCARMLSEHAFDSGSLFTQALQADQSGLQAEAERDYWRSHVAHLGEADARQFREWWKTPKDFWKQVRQLLKVQSALPPGLPMGQALAPARAAQALALEPVKAPWRGESGWAMELLGLLDQGFAAGHFKMPARKDWMHKLRAWAESDSAAPCFKSTDTAAKRLTRPAMRAAWQKGDPEALLSHPAWPALERMQADIAGLPDGSEAVLCHAAHWIAARQQTEQARRAEMGFDDLLSRLDAALGGPNGARLAALIREQFPVALIDEFQDTDPVQYRIFDRIYGVAAHDPSCALVLIGDPKQAIYGFRGADIHTYLHARRDTEGRHATLGRNFRSSDAMVAAVNHVFHRAEERTQGEGAFLFRAAQGNPVPFQRMDARGRKEVWTRGEDVPAALTLWQWPQDPEQKSAPTAEAVRSRGAQACAAHITELLAEGRAGRSGFVHPDGRLQGLKPSDIAVLVNSGVQADAVRRALSRHGVRSVYLSDRSSVFASPLAADLQRLLFACAEPDDNRALHTALGCALLGRSWAWLDRLGHDELQWEALLLQFRGYRQLWARQGVLPMLRHLLQDFEVPQRLRAAQDERGLTDVLHLAELLQQASVRLDGQHALIRWLAEERLEPGQDNDERKLRLESDAALVKVVTIHKSKGLEYPLVFLPFANVFRAATAKDMPLKWTDAGGTSRIDLNGTSAAVEAVDRERLGEDLRKLYVALTRARHATWVATAPVKDLERSALGYLLGGGASLAGPALPEALHTLAAGDEAIAVEPLPEPTDLVLPPETDSREPAPEPPLPTSLREPWWVTSYSGLNRTAAMPLDDGDTIPATAPDSATQDVYTESLRDALDSAAPLAAPASAAGLHAFPRGAGPGLFLHGLLEWAGQQGFARLRTDAALQAELAELVARRCRQRGWDAWADPLRAWLLAWIETPLRLTGLEAASPIAPAELSPSQYQVEMEFWFAVNHTGTLALDALVRRHTLGGAPRPALLPRQVNGMLKGFIDLTFEHEGRYYVADYKSNALGPDAAAYSAEAMGAAILQARYDLQYVLYVYALHRLLRSRLPDYDYERHVGGAVYLFLRGGDAPTQGLHCERPPLALMEAMDRLFAGGPTSPGEPASADLSAIA